MGKTIAIINQKGGVGKTTTAVNLSAFLAEMGRKVLVVDLDPQGNTTSGLGMAAEDNTVYEALLGRITIKDCIEETPWPNLSIAGSDIRLAGARAKGRDQAFEITLRLENRPFETLQLISLVSRLDDIFGNGNIPDSAIDENGANGKSAGRRHARDCPHGLAIAHPECRTCAARAPQARPAPPAPARRKP